MDELTPEEVEHMTTVIAQQEEEYKKQRPADYLDLELRNGERLLVSIFAIQSLKITEAKWGVDASATIQLSRDTRAYELSMRCALALRIYLADKFKVEGL